MTQPFQGFWGKLNRPIIGLAPMDGVTDFACRYIMAKYGRPDVVFTEFATAEGLFHAPEKILKDFEYDEVERPIVAQIYGNNPDDFYRAVHVVCALGFDGVDINMGCPAKQVAQRQCGAGLIAIPERAREILHAVRSAIHDWAGGQTLSDLKISDRLIEVVERMNATRAGGPTQCRVIPYSVKTRIGFDVIMIEAWVENLLQESPAVISIHGRTLKQMYKGQADWSAIARAVAVAKGSGTLILGNGDIGSLEEAGRRIQESGVDGVLIGRASLGNPWIFRGKQPSFDERRSVALEHVRYFLDHRRPDLFKAVKKHLVGYLRHLPEAASLRNRAVNTQSYGELEGLLNTTVSADL